MKVLEKCTNHGGKLYALVTDGRAFWVMGKSVNYSRGKDVVSWHKIHKNPRVTNKEFQQYAKKGMDFGTAEDFFDHLLQGNNRY
jgi:hypothetical protein